MNATHRLAPSSPVNLVSVGVLCVAATLVASACSGDSSSAAEAGAAGGAGASAGSAGAAGAGGAAGGGASGSGGAVAGPKPEDVPPLVAIAATTVDLKLGSASQPDKKSVGAYRITKTPVTVSQYRACVTAGACTVPAKDGDGCNKPEVKGAEVLRFQTYPWAGNDELPVTCTTGEQAASYCKWIGGTLPSAEEWLLAARGPEWRLHPWGSATTSCDHHPSAPVGVPHTLPCCPSSCHENSQFRVNTHPMNASPYGVVDVGFTTEMTHCRAPSTAICTSSGGPNADVSVPTQPPTTSTLNAIFRCSLPPQ